MPNLPKIEQGKYWILRTVWLSLGAVLGSDLCTFDHQELHRGRNLATLGCWLGCEQLGSTPQKSKDTQQKPEVQLEGRWQPWEVREQGWQRYIHELSERQPEMAYTSAGLFEDPRREEAGGSTTKTGEHKAQQRTVTGGPGVVVGSSDELSRWTATRSPIEGGQTEEIDYHGFEEAYRANDQGEERSGLDEAARVRHKEAWTRHVQNLVENTKAQLQQFQSVLANFDACEVELVQSFDAARRAILDITQQTTPAEEDAKAIAELDSALLAGGPGAPIEVEDEGDQKEESTDINMNEVTQLQSTLAACVSSLTESHTASDRPRSRSPRGGGTVKDF